MAFLGLRYGRARVGWPGVACDECGICHSMFGFADYLLLFKWNKFIWPCLQQSWQQDTSIEHLVSTALLLHNAGEALIT